MIESVTPPVNSILYDTSALSDVWSMNAIDSVRKFHKYYTSIAESVVKINSLQPGVGVPSVVREDNLRGT
jgi:hypothetical protein